MVATTATAPASDTITLRLARTLPAPRERVFRAWTRPEQVKQWSAPHDASVAECEIDLRVGGRYRIAMQRPNGERYTVGGIYQEVNPPARLVYTWQWEGRPDETLVTIEFNDRGAETELVLTHTRFASAEERGKHEHGWTGCLDKLEKVMG